MIFHIYERYIVPGSIILPIIIALFNYSFLNNAFKLMLLFLVFSGILNLINLVLALYSIPNLIIFHVYTIFEFAFISWFYKFQFKGGSDKIIPAIVLVFTILCVLNFIFIQNGIEFNTYTRSLEAIMIIAYCGVFFIKQSKTEYGHRWGDIGANWINISLLIYYSCSFFIFVFSNYLLVAGKQINNIVWGSYDSILLVENILFAVAFYKCRKQPIISLY